MMCECVLAGKRNRLRSERFPVLVSGFVFAGVTEARRRASHEQSTDCETVEWIHLRKTGETAAYQLQGGSGRVGGLYS